MNIFRFILNEIDQMKFDIRLYWVGRKIPNNNAYLRYRRLCAMLKLQRKEQNNAFQRKECLREELNYEKQIRLFIQK